MRSQSGNVGQGTSIVPERRLKSPTNQLFGIGSDGLAGQTSGWGGVGGPGWGGGGGGGTGADRYGGGNPTGFANPMKGNHRR